MNDQERDALAEVRGTINYILTMTRADADTEAELDMVDRLARRINAAFDSVVSS